MIDDDKALFIVVFVQGIDSNKKIYKGLINPNHFRSFGAQCVNRPTDPTGEFRFYANHVLLPLRMQGTNFLAEYFCTSDDKLP